MEIEDHAKSFYVIDHGLLATLNDETTICSPPAYRRQAQWGRRLMWSHFLTKQI